ncbi:MAG: thioredoxin domain-containing protein [Pseudomonadota bacterium]
MIHDAVKLTCLSCGQVNRVRSDKFEAAPKCAKCRVLLLDSHVGVLSIQTHDKATRTDDLPLIMDYWAPWCGPCKMMAPEFAKAAEGLRFKCRFAKIDTQQFPATSERLQIRGIPLLILYKKGQEVARLSGARPAADIEAFVRQHG